MGPPPATTRQRTGAPEEEANIGNLAFLGDSLWTLYVRNHYLAPPKHINKYHKAANKHVTAEQQAHYHDALLASGLLTQGESRLLARALGMEVASFRPRFKAERQQEQYRKATAIEALLGHLYLTDQDRLQQVMALCLRLMDGGEVTGSSAGSEA